MGGFKIDLAWKRFLAKSEAEIKKAKNVQLLKDKGKIKK